MRARGSWGKSSEITFAARDSWRERHDGAGEGTPCARGERCAAAVTRRLDDGTRARVPARSPRPLCDACGDLAGKCVHALPGLWERLGQEAHEPRANGRGAGRTPPGPRLPGPSLGGADALARALARTVCGWEARVRQVRGWTPRPAQAPVDTLRAVARACGLLEDSLAVLLALPPGWMVRWLPRAGAESRFPGAAVLAADGTAVKVLARLDGTAAAVEVIDLERRARRLLGETRAPREILDGVPCRVCDQMSLVRAEPPSDPALPAPHSVCERCGDLMSDQEYGSWAGRWSAWADREAGIPACRRCQDGLCGECRWSRCGCAASGHHSAA